MVVLHLTNKRSSLSSSYILQINDLAYRRLTCRIDESWDEDDWEEDKKDGHEFPGAPASEVLLYPPLTVLTGRVRARPPKGGEVCRDRISGKGGHVAVAESIPETTVGQTLCCITWQRRSGKIS